MIGLTKRAHTIVDADALTSNELAASLSDARWHAEAEPILGSTRPDLLISDDRGNTLVVELKRAPHGVHFGSVAQTAAFRDAAASVLGRDVAAMLVIVGADAHELDATGRDYGVVVVGTTSSEPADVAEAVRSRLSALSS